MTPIVLESAALLELTRLADADACPALTIDEQRDILARHQRATVWTASTAYNIGDRVIPTAANRNGHHFIALAFTGIGTDQKSDTTEPSWSTTRDSRHTDNHVIWQEAGWDWDGVLWNLTAAAEEAWTVKAGKSVARIDFAPSQGQSISASQLYDHCIAQAQRFRSYFAL